MIGFQDFYSRRLCWTLTTRGLLAVNLWDTVLWLQRAVVLLVFFFFNLVLVWFERVVRLFGFQVLIDPFRLLPPPAPPPNRSPVLGEVLCWLKECIRPCLSLPVSLFVSGWQPCVLNRLTFCNQTRYHDAYYFMMRAEGRNGKPYCIRSSSHNLLKQGHFSHFPSYWRPGLVPDTSLAVVSQALFWLYRVRLVFYLVSSATLTAFWVVLGLFWVCFVFLVIFVNVL